MVYVFSLIRQKSTCSLYCVSFIKSDQSFSSRYSLSCRNRAILEQTILHNFDIILYKTVYCDYIIVLKKIVHLTEL